MRRWDQYRLKEGWALFDTPVAPGHFTFCCMSLLLGCTGHVVDIIEERDGDLHFRGPVRIGDTLRLRRTYPTKDEVTGEIRCTHELVNQKGKVVMERNSTLLVRRSGPGDGPSLALRSQSTSARSTSRIEQLTRQLASSASASSAASSALSLGMNVERLLAEREIGQVVAGFSARDQGHWDEMRSLFHEPDGNIHITWFSGSFAKFVEKSMKAASRPTTPLSKHLIGLPRIRWPDRDADAGVGASSARAVAETDVQILVRAKLRFKPIEGAAGIGVDGSGGGGGSFELDVCTWGRFVDRFECRDGRWAVVERVCVYEKDRADQVGGEGGDENQGDGEGEGEAGGKGGGEGGGRGTESSAQRQFAHFVRQAAKHPEEYRFLGAMLEWNGVSLKEGLIRDKSDELDALYAANEEWLSQPQ
eukprot:g2284.t1